METYLPVVRFLRRCLRSFLEYGTGWYLFTGSGVSSISDAWVVGDALVFVSWIKWG